MVPLAQICSYSIKITHLKLCTFARLWFRPIIDVYFVQLHSESNPKTLDRLGLFEPNLSYLY